MRNVKKGTSVTWDKDWRGLSVLVLEKQKGGFTLEEIREILQHGDCGTLNGHYALLINATEGTIGGNGLWLDEPAGEQIELHILGDGEDCPVCGKLLPVFQCCPTCGDSLQKPGQSYITCLDSDCFIPWNSAAGEFRVGDVPDEVMAFYNTLGNLDYGVPCHMAKYAGKNVMVATIEIPLSNAGEYEIADDAYWRWVNSHALQLANTSEFDGKFMIYVLKNLGQLQMHQILAAFPVDTDRYRLWEAMWRLKEHGSGFKPVTESKSEYVSRLSAGFR